jgi:hypothetical protein
MPITKIVSGGQTGADRGGLDAALHCNLPHGGWCPKGRKAEDRVIPAKYELQEMPTADYLARTEANVVDSDATVIFSEGVLEGGSLRTAQFAEKHEKPWLHVDLKISSRKMATEDVIEWLQGKHPTDAGKVPPKNCVLNVAGSRGSKAPGLDRVVMVLMVDVISKVNGTLFYPINDEG